MYVRGLLGVVTLLLSAAAWAAEVHEGVLTVGGRPFYPLGSWNFEETTPEDIAKLGMNTSFRGGPGTEAGVVEFRRFMQRCHELGIEVVPYLSYGGAGVTPWAPEAVRTIAKLASEPNLLAWYVGDDITMKHLAGIEQTVSILRKETPTVPTAADYIAAQTPEAKTTFTQYVDIRCQYSYPIPDESYTAYMEFFEKQREFVGDPLWTWVQNFMWGRTGQMLNVGAEGPGPIPDPEQVRLLAHAAINRGVRGLLFFAHHELHRMPELAAEVALTCREVRLVDEYLAAGTPTFNLETSSPDLSATAFAYQSTTAVSLAVFKPFYHRYVDEGILENVSVVCPWNGDGLPKALLVATPEVVACEVTQADKPSTVRVAVPRLELAGFVLLSTDESEIQRLTEETSAIPEFLAPLLAPAAAAQARKVGGTLWQLGIDHLYESNAGVMPVMRAVEHCNGASIRNDFREAFLAWRESFRGCRKLLAGAMDLAEGQRGMMSAKEQSFLLSPYGLHNIEGLGEAPEAGDPWHYCREWLIAGPFPLEMNQEDETRPPPGFERVYPPEAEQAAGALFETVDGPSGWHAAEAGLSGLLPLYELFSTTDGVVAYARCTITAPADGEVRLGLGSNDGARLWVNGELVYSEHGPRGGSPRDEEIVVPLRSGPNTVLAKVENLGQNWKLYLSIHDPARVYQFSR